MWPQRRRIRREVEAKEEDVHMLEETWGAGRPRAWADRPFPDTDDQYREATLEGASVSVGVACGE